MLSPRPLTKRGKPGTQRPCQPDPTPSTQPLDSGEHAAAPRRGLRRQPARGRSCKARHGAARNGAVRRDAAPPPAAPNGPGPAHPSSAMALSVGADPARVPAANTDTGRPGEWRRPPRGPRPARSRRDAPPAAGIQPGRPRRHYGYSPRHRREPPAKKGAGLPPHALIAREDPSPRGRGGCPRRCLIRRLARSRGDGGGAAFLPSPGARAGPVRPGGGASRGESQLRQPARGPRPTVFPRAGRAAVAAKAVWLQTAPFRNPWQPGGRWGTNLKSLAPFSGGYSTRL